MQTLRSEPMDGPRERALRAGAGALSDEELIALLLGTGLAGEPVTVLAARILASVGGLSGLGRAGTRGIAELRGVGAVRALRLVAAMEMGRRAQARPLPTTLRIGASSDVDAAMRPRLAHLEVEVFYALALDARNRPIAELKIATGTIDACAVGPADVFRALLREAATGVVLVHNHPSGRPEPSREDIELTARIVRAGQILGVRVLDHVIVASEGYYSFLDAGLLVPGFDDDASVIRDQP